MKEKNNKRNKLTPGLELRDSEVVSDTECTKETMCQPKVFIKTFGWHIVSFVHSVSDTTSESRSSKPGVSLFLLLFFSFIYQLFFLFSGKFFDPFLFQERLLEILVLPVPHEFNGTPVSCILGSLAVIMHFNTLLEIRGIPRVIGLIRTFDNVREKPACSLYPASHGTYLNMKAIL